MKIRKSKKRTKNKYIYIKWLKIGHFIIQIFYNFC